jgi:hypothetical protein
MRHEHEAIISPICLIFTLCFFFSLFFRLSSSSSQGVCGPRPEHVRGPSRSGLPEARRRHVLRYSYISSRWIDILFDSVRLIDVRCLLRTAGGPFNSSFLEPLVQMAYYGVSTLGRGSGELASAALEIFKCLSRLKNRLVYVGSLPVMKTFALFAGNTVRPRYPGTPPDHPLSTLNQALMWEYVGSIAHEIAAGDTAVSQTMGQSYLMEVRIESSYFYFRFCR